MNKTMVDVQAKFDLCVLASPTSWGGSFARSCQALVNAKATAKNATAQVTYLTIPEVARGVANVRNYLETNCLLKNPLGQYVITENVLNQVTKRVDEINLAIQKAVDVILTNYDTTKKDFEDSMKSYLEAQLGKTQAKKELADLMGHYPLKQQIADAAVAIRLDYVSGSSALQGSTIKMVEESKAQELVANYQNMVLRAVTPCYQKLGQLINQSVEDKMSERTLSAYRKALKALEEDNAILSNPALKDLVFAGSMAINNGDYAEMLLVNIFRLVDDAGVAHELPDVPRYDFKSISEMAKDELMPQLAELVTIQKKALGKEDE